MSRVHNALRRLENGGSSQTVSALISAMLRELADEVPDEAYLEGVRADLVVASRMYETAKKEDIALRFYLAISSLLKEQTLLRERLKRADGLDSEVLEQRELAAPAGA